MAFAKQGWNPTFALLKAGEASLDLPFLSSSVSLRWSFNRGIQKFIPFSVVECILESPSFLQVQGFSVHSNLQNAMRVALAEATERIVFKLYAKSGQCPPQSLQGSTGYAAGQTVPLAIKAAEEEYKERYLLLKASEDSVVLEKYAFSGFSNKFLVRYLTLQSKYIEAYTYRGLQGRVLFAWMQEGPGAYVYDSIYFPDGEERERSRRLLLSLLGSFPPRFNSLQIDPELELTRSSLGDCMILETRVLYAGGSLAPVALAFDPSERPPFLSQLTQDQVFAALLSKTHHQA